MTIGSASQRPEQLEPSADHGELTSGGTLTHNEVHWLAVSLV